MFKRTLSRQRTEGSFFLFGPRQTGKSTWLKSEFSNSLVIDLLKPTLSRALNAEPESLVPLIREFALAQKSGESARPLQVIIDEVQKAPDLLDVIHSIMFDGGISLPKISTNSNTEAKNRSALQSCEFILTGSSPRNLLRAGKNLLGGRAAWKTFHPLTLSELKSDPERSFDLAKVIQWGGMPSAALLKNKKQWFDNYREVFLETEVRNEGLVRSLPQFERFLRIAAAGISEQVVFRSLASDLGINEKTVTSWYQILTDTLLGELLPCFSLSQKRKPVSSPKFFFFDCGVGNSILGRYNIQEGSGEYAVALENLVYQNLKALCSYSNKKCRLYYWRTVDKTEVDFVVCVDDEPRWAIEVKSTRNPKLEHFSGLKKFQEEFPNTKCALVCNSKVSLVREDGLHVAGFEPIFEKIEQDLLGGGSS